MSDKPTHNWSFVRLGGLDQVVINSGEDLLNLKDLDQKLWVALACPVKGLEINEKTLSLIDRDQDGRIRVPELLEAIRWASLHLKDVSLLLQGGDTLPLDAINTDTPEGKGTLASARAILRGLGRADASEVTLTQAADTMHLFAATPFNGDGIITNKASNDPVVKAVIDDIVSTSGGRPELGGGVGIDQAQADAFFQACADHIGWLDQGNTPDVLTLGDKTADAHAAIQTVRAKVDDYFARARLAAYDQRALPALNHAESEYFEIVSKDLSITAEELSAFPLIQIEAGQPLPLLADNLNPAWSAALATLHRAAVTPAFGADKTALTLAEWEALKSRIAPYSAWLANRKDDAIAKLAPDRIREILAANPQSKINELIAKDKALEPEFNAINGVERLILYCRDFAKLLRNFVNFLDFYDPQNTAIFQAGRLFLDSRSTELCIQITDPSPLAAMSKIYIAYCDCTRPGRPPMKIAACFTQGDSDYLFVGRNGVFYDRKGLDWDAKITAVVDNPISVRQAFFSPYKKFVRMIEEQVAKRAAAAEASADAKLSTAAEGTVAGTTPPKPADGKKVDVGTVAALGVAFGAIGTFLTALIGYASGIVAGGPLLIAAALLGVILVISGPSMIIAWIKLRQRTLGPILDSNGWAINGRVKISVPFGTRLTRRARIPAGSKHSLDDPYADKAAIRRRRLWTILIIVVIAYGIRLHAVYLNDGHYFWQKTTTTSPATPPAS